MEESNNEAYELFKKSICFSDAVIYGIGDPAMSSSNAGIGIGIVFNGVDSDGPKEIGMLFTHEGLTALLISLVHALNTIDPMNIPSNNMN